MLLFTAPVMRKSLPPIFGTEVRIVKQNIFEKIDFTSAIRESSVLCVLVLAHITVNADSILFIFKSIQTIFISN